MIPLKDVIPSRTRPWVTMLLIALNLGVFIFEMTLPDDALKEFVRAYGLKAYAFSWPNVFTSMFIHGGVLHVVANMWCLWIFGDNVEDQMGHGRFLIFYLLCGSMAALAQLILHGPMLPMVGASGAIAGVMGAYLFMFPRSAVYVFIFVGVTEIPAGVFLPLWFVIQLLGAVDTRGITGEYGDVAFWAHVGGFLMGVAGVLVFRRSERATVEWLDGALSNK